VVGQGVDAAIKRTKGGVRDADDGIAELPIGIVSPAVPYGINNPACVEHSGL
jgi:hypothetical protein